AGGFRSCILAPAFPAQQRVTRAGRQLFRDGEGAWRAAGCELAPALAAAGLAPRLVSTARGLSGRGLFLCDAESEADLQAIVAAAGPLEGPLLWCGSAGLAAALAGRPLPPAMPGPAPLLLLVGSRHPVARAQLERLGARHPGIAVDLASGPPEATAAAVALGLRQRGAALGSFALPEGLDESAASL